MPARPPRTPTAAALVAAGGTVAAWSLRRMGRVVRWARRSGAPLRSGGDYRAALGLRLGPRPLLGFLRTDRRDPCAAGDLELCRWARAVVEVGHRHARQPAADCALDASQLILFLRRHEGE